MQDNDCDGQAIPHALRFDRRGGRRRPAMGWISLLRTAGGHRMQLRRQTTARMIDLSDTGIGLRTDQAMQEGDAVTLLMPPHGPRPGFDQPAEVAWCRAADDGTYRIGLRYLRRWAA